MPKKKILYQEATDEISSIIYEIENNNVDIDQLSDKVKRVSFLLEYCKTKLHDTEKYMERMFNENTDEKK